MVRPTACVVLLLSSLAAAALGAGPEAARQPEPAGRFGDEIAVRLVTVVVRVVDGAGHPLLGLTPGNFRVRVGRREVPVAAVDWMSSGEAPEGAAGAAASVAAVEQAGAAPAAAALVPPDAGTPSGRTPRQAERGSESATAGAPGKLVVIFVQADANEPGRVRGHLRTLPFTRELLAMLAPEDRVAVVSFDAHLKLWQDFTRDREVIPAAIFQGIRYGGHPPTLPAPLPQVPTTVGFSSQPLAGGGFASLPPVDAASPALVAAGAGSPSLAPMASAGSPSLAAAGGGFPALPPPGAAGSAALAPIATASPSLPAGTAGSPSLGAAGGGSPSLSSAGAAFPSLAAHFDARKALAAASAERALQVTAEALAALPGEKALVFLAWGLGNFSSSGTQMTPAFRPAARALAAARVTVFVLDVTEADAHDLEVGLEGIAEATGGTYDKTYHFPALAVRQLARTISGHYVLTLDTAALPRAGGRVEVELRGRKGTLLVRPTAVPAS